MPLESGNFIDSLVPSNPVASDDRSQGDDHIRLIKAVLKNTFPNVTGAVTATQSELNSAGGGGGEIDAELWGGSRKFVGTSDPTPGIGENGDVFFVVET